MRNIRWKRHGNLFAFMIVETLFEAVNGNRETNHATDEKMNLLAENNLFICNFEINKKFVIIHDSSNGKIFFRQKYKMLRTYIKQKNIHDQFTRNNLYARHTIQLKCKVS